MSSGCVPPDGVLDVVSVPTGSQRVAEARRDLLTSVMQIHLT